MFMTVFFHLEIVYVDQINLSIIYIAQLLL